MLQGGGVSGLLGNPGDGSTAAVAHEGVSAAGSEVVFERSVSGGFGDEDKGRTEEGDRSSAGNRWPRQETLALLQIRSDMDVAFRDSSLKGPLWEEVSRKLAELGYRRSAKKCKEKFENVYKYHKRTKEGRATKPDSKTYRFFDQLEALDNQPLLPQIQPPAAAPIPQPPPAVAPPQPSPPPPMPANNIPPPVSQVTVPSIAANPNTLTAPPALNTSMNPMFTSTSSSTSSDEDRIGRKRKRKWKEFFERLMKEVMDKQEEMQKRFLEVIEKRERDRMAREEAWKMQEMARMNREHEILVQERSVAAAKDAAVIAFLQKLSDQQQQQQQQQQTQQQPPNPIHVHDNPAPAPPPPPPLPVAPPQTVDNGENFTPTSSSRWPKAEVQALINLRTSLDVKYQDSGPKGPLWEEISAAMRKLGYNRNAKRCKEKWENINKYFKKVKESNKRRPEDSKTCPYFHQLDALYREKKKVDSSSFNQMAPLMVQPEQQWPLQRDRENETMGNRNPEEEDEEEEEDEDEEGEDEDGDEEEDEGGGYEIVSNKLPA